MCDPFTLLLAVLVGAAIAGSPIAMRTVSKRFSGGGTTETAQDKRK
jgi:hypothetical protein